MSSNAQKMAERVRQEVERAANKGLTAAAIFLAARVKEVLNVKAPMRKVGGRWVVTARATPGRGGTGRPATPAFRAGRRVIIGGRPGTVFR